jgi:DNA-binding transcriptional ArsR family regulator
MVEHMPESLSRVYFALADPTRRAILLLVADGEKTVTAIAAPFAMSLAAVSKHIRVLEQAGLLKRSRQGREHRLRFDAEPLRDAGDWINRFERFWTDHLDRIKELAERKARDRARARDQTTDQETGEC